MKKNTNSLFILLFVLISPLATICNRCVAKQKGIKKGLHFATHALQMRESEYCNPYFLFGAGYIASHHLESSFNHFANQA